MTITIAIPTIPPRAGMLKSAVGSVLQQRHPVDAISIAVDNGHEGAWATRNRALSTVDTEWIGFLDDDDVLLPHHVGTLLKAAKETEADLIWGWFEVIGGQDPFPQHRGRQYDIENPHIFPITYLCRTSVLRAAIEVCGGFQPDTTGNWGVQDKPVIDAIVNLGGKLVGIEDITWQWHHHGMNTSGQPERWD